MLKNQYKNDLLYELADWVAHLIQMMILVAENSLILLFNLSLPALVIKDNFCFFFITF